MQDISFSYGDLWDVGLWDLMTWGGNANTAKLVNTKGSGKFIQWMIKHENNSQIFHLMV